MSTSPRDAARAIMEAARRQTPEQWHRFYRGSYPDITEQEARELYPIFLQAIDAKTKAERERAFKKYRAALAPIQRRQQGAL